jgi:hypothetical protein
VNTSRKKTSSAATRQKAARGHSDTSGGKTESETESVDKIRDILFGHQMRDYDKRFARLEDRLLSEIKELREATSKQLDSVEAFIRKEIELLNQQLKAGQEQRTKDGKAISKNLESNVRTITNRMDKQDEKQRKESQELRQQLLEQTKSLTEQIRSKHQESMQALQDNVVELRAEKMDRSALSQMFVEMAVRMSDELATKLNAELGDAIND